MVLGLRPLCLALLVTAAAGAGRDEPRPTLGEYEAGKAAEAAGAATAAARDAKTAAVERVVSMLVSLQAQVEREGEKEAETYDKFACFCKDTTAEKTEAIEEGKDAESTLSSTITALSSDRDALDVRRSALLEDTREAQQALEAAAAARAEENAEFETNEADLSAALAALRGAISTLKASEAPSLAQLRSVAKTVRAAVELADALGLADAANKRDVAALLQQAPEVPMEDYNFHSGGIISTLETLLSSFQKQHTEVEAEEAKAVAAHEAFVQEKTDLLKQKNLQLEDAQKVKSEKQAEIASNTQRLATVSATLLDDQQYLAELASLCSERATTWDQRSKVRQDELAALTAAINIITTTVHEKTSAATVRLMQQSMGMRLPEAVAINPKAMEAVEAAAEAVEARVAAAPALIQLGTRHFLRRSRPEVEGRQAVLKLLRSSATQLKSTLLTSLAARIAADPLAKVKTLIQELIERLLQEAGNEENHKGWCDKSIADAEQKRGYAAQAIERLNGEMAQLEGTRNTLNEELSVLAAEMADLGAREASAEALRASEQAENEVTVEEAQEGLAAVSSAIDILDKFYKTAAKAAVLVQQQRQSPAVDAPDLGFEGGEAYTGSQGSATGILGLLDVVSSDFKRTIAATEAAEAQAEKDHLAFLTETGKSLAEKGAASEEKARQRDDAAEELSSAAENFQSQSEILESSLKELLTLQPACVNTGTSYEERVARREDEMAALRKAICVLENFGPGGARGDC